MPADDRHLRDLLWRYTTEWAALLATFGGWSAWTGARPHIIDSYPWLAMADRTPSREPVQRALESPPFEALVRRTGHTWFWPGNVIGDLLVERVLARSFGGAIDRAAFAAVYRDLLGELKAPTMRLRAVSVINGYPRPSRPTMVSSLGRLVPFALQDGHGTLYQLLALNGQRDVREPIEGPGFFLVLETTVGKQGDDPRLLERVLRELQGRAERALTLMRLTSSGVVKASATYLVQVSRFPVIPPMAQHAAEGEAGWFQSAAPLSASLRRRLRDADRIVASSSQSLATAIGQLDRSYRQQETSQNIVDLVVALEGLVGVKAEELKMRLAQRCALLLGDGGARSRTVYRDVRAAYEIRNQLVHGQKSRQGSRDAILKQAKIIAPPPNGLARDVADREALWRVGHTIRAYVRQAIWGYARLHGYLGAPSAWPKEDPDEWGELLFDPARARRLRRLAGTGSNGSSRVWTRQPRRVEART